MSDPKADPFDEYDETVSDDDYENIGHRELCRRAFEAGRAYERGQHEEMRRIYDNLNLELRKLASGEHLAEYVERVKERDAAEAEREKLRGALEKLRDTGPKSYKPAFFHDCVGACSWCVETDAALSGAAPAPRTPIEKIWGAIPDEPEGEK